jgi:hypothetical protein
MPHSTYSKKKSFHLLEGTMNFFESWERSKMEETAQKFKNDFYKQIIFTALPKFYATHRIYEILSQSLVPAIEGNCLVKKSAKSFSSKQLYHLLI